MFENCNPQRIAKENRLSSRMSILLAAIAYVSCWLRLPVELVLYDVAS